MARAIRGLFNGNSYEEWTTGLFPALGPWDIETAQG